MLRWALTLLVAGVARGETWADEPVSAPQQHLRAPPLFGVTAGVHLLLSAVSNVGPSPGARLGGRVRLSQHVALSLMGMYELESFQIWTRRRLFEPVEETLLQAHVLHGVLRVELFSQSAFEHLLVPELTVGLMLGAGGAFERDLASASFLGGVHLGITRLRPSGWWFPLFVELAVQVFSSASGATPYVSAPLWRLGVGVGL